MPEQWLEEFCYRGRPPSGPDADKEPAYHIIIGTQYDHPAKSDEKIRELSPALTAGQAKEMGFDIPTILEGINIEAGSIIAERNAQIEVLEQQLAILSTKLAVISKALAEGG